MIPKIERPAELNDYQKSELAVFDLQLKKTIKMFVAEGFKRFVLIGDFLIFDVGTGRDSRIEVFDLGSLKI